MKVVLWFYIYNCFEEDESLVKVDGIDLIYLGQELGKNVQLVRVVELK